MAERKREGGLDDKKEKERKKWVETGTVTSRTKEGRNGALTKDLAR